MDEKLQYQAGALIRGLTFDGHRGMIVRYRKKRPEVPEDHILSLKASDYASLKEALLQAWEEYLSRNNTLPSVVELADIGCYTLQEAYDLPPVSRPVSSPIKRDQPVARDRVVQGKIALVTGGAQGFGEGMVRGLVDAGAIVYVADLQLDKAQELCDQINAQAGQTKALALYVDVTDEQSVERMFQEVTLYTGSLDICISNAGVLKAGSVKEMSLKDFDFVTQVDYTGFFLCTKYAARLLAVQNEPTGRYYTDIIAVSSKSGLEGSNKNGAYAGAKFGTIGLTQSFALELIEDNIKVNALCPGNFLEGPLWSDPERGLFVQYLKTGKVPGAQTIDDVRKFYEAKVPMKRGCRSEDVLKAVFYVVEQNYETGQAIPITGGQVMLN